MAFRRTRLIQFFIRLLPGLLLIVVQLPSIEGATTFAATNQEVLTILLRDSHGDPLQGVLCEVLSYDWGRPMGQPYGVIARGETDKNGVVAFEVGAWPHSGYRFKFTKTNHTLPADTFFEDAEMNQYRGYPAATVGGRTEGQRFLIASDGLAYNDLSEEGQKPDYEKNPVGGLEKPRMTILPSEDFLATVRAGTATAGAAGLPSPTRPARPAATPAFPQAALNVTPAALLPTATAAPVQGQSGEVVNIPTAPAVRATQTHSNRPGSVAGKNEPTGKAENNLFSSLLMALAGVICFGVFWKFRRYIYPWLGIESVTFDKRKAKRRPKIQRPTSLSKEKAAGQTEKGGEHVEEAEKGQ